MKKTIRNDIILIGTFLLIAVIALIIINLNKSKDSLVAYVYHKDELVLTINLEELDDNTVEYIVLGDNGPVVIWAKHNAIKVESETSPYHICSKQGFVTDTITPLICLPNSIYIKIVGNNANDIDVEI